MHHLYKLYEHVFLKPDINKEKKNKEHFCLNSNEKEPYYYTFTFHIIIIGIKFVKATQKHGRHIRPVLPAVQVSLWTFPENPLVRHSCNYKTPPQAVSCWMVAE